MKTLSPSSQSQCPHKFTCKVGIYISQRLGFTIDSSIPLSLTYEFPSVFSPLIRDIRANND